MPKISWTPKSESLNFIIWRPITKTPGHSVRIYGETDEGCVDTTTLDVSIEDGKMEYPVAEIMLSQLHSVWKDGFQGYARDSTPKQQAKDWIGLTEFGKKELAKLKNSINNMITKFHEKPETYTINLLKWNKEHLQCVYWNTAEETIEEEKPAKSEEEEEEDDDGVKESMTGLIDAIKERLKWPYPEEENMRTSMMLEILTELVRGDIRSLNEGLREQRWGRELLAREGNE